ncbi:uncharacterized protein DS421_8g224500 [Arachis hypogaea]|nr:uncharacterized protein DS421_8g224500 [Arachis hypogaea]
MLTRRESCNEIPNPLFQKMLSSITFNPEFRLTSRLRLRVYLKILYQTKQFEF